MKRGSFQNSYKSQKYRKRSREESGGSSGGKGNGDNNDSDNDDLGYQDTEDTVRHRGSIPLEDIQKTPEYAARPVLDGPKRKYAVCFGYLGSRYQGLQINPNCRSVEAELERALFLCGAIQECNFGFMHKSQWSRAARTDRGVHAAGQCCAMKLAFPVGNRKEIIEHMNRLLPGDIRVLALTKVTKNFNSKILCSQRRYNFLLPTYLFTPHHTVNSLLEDSLRSQGPLPDCAREGGFAEPGSVQFLSPASLASVRSSLGPSFSCSEAQLSTMRQALGHFVGTKSYHNYTTGKKISDASATRFIKSFECSEPFRIPVPGLGAPEEGAVEWVLLSVLGQSFLLNQIRKMVGMAVEVGAAV